jgi:hypothetical protein
MESEVPLEENTVELDLLKADVLDVPRKVALDEDALETERNVDVLEVPRDVVVLEAVSRDEEAAKENECELDEIEARPLVAVPLETDSLASDTLEAVSLDENVLVATAVDRESLMDDAACRAAANLQTPAAEVVPRT